MILAAILGDTGRYQDSLDIQRAVYNEQHARYGPDNPRTLSSMPDLAVTLNMNGNFEESKGLSQHVFKSNINFYGSEHPRTWNIEFNLGLLFERQGDLVQVEAHFKNVLTGPLNSPKRNHLETVDCIRHLVSCLEKKQNDEEANSYNQLLRKLVKEGHVPREGVSDIEASRSLNSDGKDEEKPQAIVEQEPRFASPISGTAEVVIGGEGWGEGRHGWYHGETAHDTSYGGKEA
jgi:tetratricopeptide (TPR) repeat protein